MSPVHNLPSGHLCPHPQNPRPRLTEAEVSDLKASIEAHGQVQPCVVRSVGENGKKHYEVVIGHRRAFVGKLLGRDVPCLVEDLDDDEALALMLSDNRVRTDPDPFMESKAVDALLKKEGHTLQSVADLLGKSPKWVAQRANLRTLTEKSRKALSKVGWPVSWLEEWARLSPEVQDAEVERNSWVKDWGQLKGIVSRHLRTLGKAPWGLEDAILVSKAGACSSCPKQSMHSPGLFSDGEEKDVKKATCRDALCWKAKTNAHASKVLSSLRKDQPDLPIVAGDIDAKHLPCMKDLRVLDIWQVESAKKGSKGSIPALRVSSDGRVSRLYLKAPRASQSPQKAEKKVARDMSPKERLEASKARIQRRRDALVLDLLRQAILDLKAPELSLVGGLVAAYEVSPSRDSTSLKGRQALFAKKWTNWEKEVWERLKGHLAEALRWGTDESLAKAVEEGRWLAEVIRIDLKAMEEKATKEVPAPKWWPASYPAAVRG